MLMSNASYMCSDTLKAFEKSLRLPQGSDDVDILAIYMCPGNGSEVTFKLSNQVQSLKESVSISGWFVFVFVFFFFIFKACSALLYITITK